MRMLGANGLTPRHPSVAKLFGSNDTEAVARLITALLVLDPLALAVTREHP
jgi:hypothetical protein